MKQIITLFLIISFFTANNAYAKQYEATAYYPLSQEQCLENKERLGLQFCPHDDDHLAGAALSCGHINNLPSEQDLQELAQKIYHQNTTKTSIYGNRDDELMQSMGIWVNDSHIYYWTSNEAKDEKGGYVRMFALKGSIPYYAPRDGSGYVSNKLGKINYGNTKYVVPEYWQINSNIHGAPNEDALLTICYR